MKTRAQSTSERGPAAERPSGIDRTHEGIREPSSQEPSPLVAGGIMTGSPPRPSPPRDGRFAALQAMADGSPRVRRARAFQATSDRRMAPLQGRFELAPARRHEKETPGGEQDTPPRPGEEEAAEQVVGSVLTALRLHREWLVAQDAAAAAVLTDHRLGLTVAKMYVAATDHGRIDLDNEMLLLQFYYRLKLELGGGNQVTEEHETAEKETRASQDAWTLYRKTVAAEAGVDPERVYRTVLIGRGASAAYVVANGGVPLDESTLVIGEEQPWRGERGKDGVINHPHGMIDPEHGDGDILDDGLASRQEFSNRVDAIFKRLAQPPLNAKVTSVKKEGSGAAARYRIIAGNHLVVAQRVIAAVGIGKHAKPEGLPKQLDEYKTTGEVPRIMDMDVFQVAVAEGRLTPADAPNGVIVVGPNAAIDVMSTSLRKSFKPLFWLTGVQKDPFFLDGTDNEFVKKTYGAAKDRPEGQHNGKDVRFRDGDFSIIQGDLLNAQANAEGVEVEYGKRADKRAKPEVPQEQYGKQAGSILVYGTGPDVGGLLETFKDIRKEADVEPVYDTGLHFTARNTDDRISIEEAIRKATGSKAETVLQAVVQILGDLEPIDRGVLHEPMPSTLPGVIGLKATKTDEADPTSLEFTSGAAFRLAQHSSLKPRYQYLSKQFAAVVGTDLASLDRKTEALAKQANFEEAVEHAEAARSGLYKLAVEGKALAESLEGGKSAEVLDKLRDLLGLREDIEGAIRRMQFAIAHQAQQRNAPAEAAELDRGVTGLRNWMHQLFEQMDEFRHAVENDRYGNLASTHMGGAPLSLPQNVVLSDQLTTSRATVEARQEQVPQTIAEGVDFITRDHTVIAAHIASAFPSIPAALADHVTMKIVHDRRHLPLDKAPLPRPNEELGPNNTFNLNQQREFQGEWSERLGRLARLFPER